MFEGKVGVKNVVLGVGVVRQTRIVTATIVGLHNAFSCAAAAEKVNVPL